ncbi:MAG: hypothetical protein WCD76_08055 [Pyrinomonadaceae bacterium]
MIVCVLSWLVGVAVYLSSLYIGYGETVGWADLTAVLGWSFAAVLIAFPLIYLPVLLMLRRLLRGNKPVAAFPVVAALLCIIPTSLISFMFSDSIAGFLRSFVSHEAPMFYCMFIAAGVMFGLGFVWCYRDDAI